MRNANDSRPDEPENAGAKESEDRSSEATSDKTLSDLEGAEEVSSSEGSNHESPAPDGQFDGDHAARDDAGPM